MVQIKMLYMFRTASNDNCASRNQSHRVRPSSLRLCVKIYHFLHASLMPLRRVPMAIGLSKSICGLAWRMRLEKASQFSL